MNEYIKREAAKYKLFARCYTYNQKRFILDTLHGFAIQRTSFPFACVIVDDASQDGEQNVINDFIEKKCDVGTSVAFENELLKLISVRHKENTNCFFYFYLLKINLFRSPEKKSQIIQPWRDACLYEALCEGDDYWVDDNKLQKQYDILENDKTVSFVYTGFTSVNEDGAYLDRPFLDTYQSHSHSGNVFFDLLVNLNFIMTLTVVLRVSCRKDMPIEYYDYGIFLNWERQGNAVFLPDKTSCYRYNKNSITNTVKDSLLPKFYYIVFNEVRKAFTRENTSEIIYKEKQYLTILGYVIARNIRKSTERKNFITFTLSHPSLYYHVIKGFFIKLFAEKKIRSYVNKL